MAITLTDFKLSKCEVVISQELPWIHATSDFLASCSSCVLGCGEVKCPMILHRQMWLWQLYFKEDCLEKVCGKFQLKEKLRLFFPSPATVVYTARTKIYWLCGLCFWLWPSCKNCTRKDLSIFIVTGKIFCSPFFCGLVLLKFDGTLSRLLCSLSCHSWRSHVRDCVYIFGVSEIKSRHAVNIQFIPRLCRISRNKMSAAYLLIFKLFFGQII